ncbi:sensor histidine kinase [Terriglobus sp. ADX1]|uniref:sensor histidine kinase n=1 Tax=Terriglobus sp. ADX1 TaxID=2794063 RepID=UPI002FE57A27
MNNNSQREHRTIILAPIGRDAQLIANFIEKLGKPCHVTSSVDDLCNEIQVGAASAIVAEEALGGNAIEALKPTLMNQPSWSDFPLIILVAGGRVTMESERLRKIRLPLGNVVLLERPLRPETLSSTLELALRGRERQYQIRDQIAQVERAQEALRRSEKLAVTGRLAASIAHEINNPLESVTNLLYLARSENLTDAAQNYLQQAENELARVTEIAKHTLRFYKEPNQPTQVDLINILDSVLTLYHSRLIAAKVEVKKEVAPSSLPIIASPGELRQVVANLIGNALDAMRNGGKLRLRVSIEHYSGDGAAKARLSIADTGHGIPKHVLPMIFEPFVTTKGETGTGLGLWVTDEIVKKNGWSMRVRSNTQQKSAGTVFSLLMPLPQR